MLTPTAAAADMLRTAIQAFVKGEGLAEALETIDAPVYATDADGVVTHFNSACIGFSGRTPAAGQDRWCVTWRLYGEDGQAMSRADCPMAQALRERRPIRGVTAIAERPDGGRVAFMPLATPVFAADGALVGAVNLLIDVTDLKEIEALRARADRCERLARSLTDERAAETLETMAAEYLAEARQRDHPNGLAALG